MTDSPTTQLFDALASGYDRDALRLFPFSADRMLQAIEPRRGEKLLDVATGTGAVAVRAARMVGREGRVSGIDLSEAMLARAEANARRLGVENIDLRVMNAQKLEFRRDSFDVLTCGFGIFFLVEMKAALKSWLRVLKSGGRMIFSAFTADAFQPHTRMLGERLAVYGVDIANVRERLGMSKLDSADACRELAEGVGFTDVQVERVDLSYYLADVEQWWKWSGTAVCAPPCWIWTPCNSRNCVPAICGMSPNWSGTTA